MKAKFIKFSILWWSCILVPCFGIAQKNPHSIPLGETNRDSLRKVINSPGNPVLHIEALRNLAYSYIENRRDSAMYYYENLMSLVDQTKNKLWEADASNSIGFLSYVSGNYPRSLQFLLRALEIAGNPDTEKDTWDSSDHSLVNPRIARLTVLARTHLHLAGLYGYTGNYKDNVAEQLFHFTAAEKIATEINDQVMLSLVNMNLGRHYYFREVLDSALTHIQKALEFIRQTGYTKYKGSALMTMGNIYLGLKQTDRAKQAFQESVQASLDNNNLRSLGDVHLSIARFFHETNQTDSSIVYGQLGLNNFQTTGILSGVISACNQLSETYLSMQRTDSAFKYLHMAMQVSDSLNTGEKLRRFQTMNLDERLRQQLSEKEKEAYRNQVRTYGLLAGLAVFFIIALLLYRNSRQKEKTNRILANQKQILETTLGELKATQTQLIQSEKMASLGELTAGIAHEIQNPLNFVNNFSEVNKELTVELEDELDKGNYTDARDIAKDIRDNEIKINHHGKRADAIVKGMLAHSRSGSGQKEPTDINALCDEYLRLAYHGLKARDKNFEASFHFKPDSTLPKINLVPQDIGRVLLNLINNAFQAVNGFGEKPMVIVTTLKRDNIVEIKVADNGPGIPDAIRDKIFQPFFTTKPTGQGTGLGLSLSYDIVNAHGGSISVISNYNEPGTITVNSFNSPLGGPKGGPPGGSISVISNNNEPGTGTEFVISLPQ